MSQREIVLSKPLAVNPASHARISFNVGAPAGAELFIEHLRGKELLAREARPLQIGATSLEAKIHPDATHVGCQLQISQGRQRGTTYDVRRHQALRIESSSNQMPIDGVRFALSCGERIEPTQRHFIIIGAMKAGTTTLFELLAKHPALCRTWASLPGVSFTKEINYFTRQYRKGHTPLHYDWRFPFDPTRHAWTLDASPNYAKWPRSRGVPERIAALGGETKLAYVLREPVDRIESHMAHTLNRKGRADLDACIRTSRYALQLDKYMPPIDRDDILLLDFEQLRRKPSTVVTQVCDFLNIERVPGYRAIHNRRLGKFRLDGRQRAQLAETLRPDVERLISHYGFSPAERWLRKPSLSWLPLSGLRR